MLRALVIDDEPESLENIVTLLGQECPNVDIIATGGSNADLVKLVNQDRPEGPFDVAFLDIKLSDGLVFQGLQQLDEVPFDIIFVTSFDKYALRAFEFAAIHYVVKPIERAELRKAVARIRPRNTDIKRRLEAAQQNINAGTPNAFEKIGISGVDGVHFVRLRDIVRLEAEDNYTHFLLKSGERITASRTIKAYEETLAQMNFVRVHKKHIVNLNYMKTYIRGEGGYLVLENGETIEVSRRKKSALSDSVKRHYGEI